MNSSFSSKGINFVGQLSQIDQQAKECNQLKTEFDIIESQFHYSDHLFSSQFSSMKNYTSNINDLVIQGPHLIKKHLIYCLNKSNSTIVYEFLVAVNKARLKKHTLRNSF